MQRMVGVPSNSQAKTKRFPARVLEGDRSAGFLVPSCRQHRCIERLVQKSSRRSRTFAPGRPTIHIFNICDAVAFRVEVPAEAPADSTFSCIATRLFTAVDNLKILVR